jgi:hypothetical protein
VWCSKDSRYIQRIRAAAQSAFALSFQRGGKSKPLVFSGPAALASVHSFANPEYQPAALQTAPKEKGPGRQPGPIEYSMKIRSKCTRFRDVTHITASCDFPR